MNHCVLLRWHTSRSLDRGHLEHETLLELPPFPSFLLPLTLFSRPSTASRLKVVFFGMIRPLPSIFVSVPRLFHLKHYSWNMSFTIFFHSSPFNGFWPTDGRPRAFQTLRLLRYPSFARTAGMDHEEIRGKPKSVPSSIFCPFSSPGLVAINPCLRVERSVSRVLGSGRFGSGDYSRILGFFISTHWALLRVGVCNNDTGITFFTSTFSFHTFLPA